MTSPVILEVEGASQQFGGLRAVSDVSLTVRKGELVGVIGPNGAGKSSLFNGICGLQRFKRGSVRFRGRDITRLRADRVSRLGLVKTSQRVQVFPRLSTLENAAIGAVQRVAHQGEMYRRASAAVAEVGLGGREHVAAESLNLVERVRLELARALAADPSLLLVDEILAGMGTTEASRMCDSLRELVRERGITLLLIEHNLDAVMRLCERVVVLVSGSIVADGTPREVAQDPGVVSAFLGDYRHA